MAPFRIPFQINHKPDKSSVFGSLSWLVNVTERPLSNLKWSPGGNGRTTTHFKASKCVEALCLRATPSFTASDHSCASVPFEIASSSENTGASTYGQKASQPGLGRYSQATSAGFPRPTSTLRPRPRKLSWRTRSYLAHKTCLPLQTSSCLATPEFSALLLWLAISRAFWMTQFDNNLLYVFLETSMQNYLYISPC